MNRTTPAAAGSARSRAISLLLVLLFAAALRIAALPGRHEIRDFDEIGYETCGLVAWEGMEPGWRFVPAGPQTWVGWLYAGASSAWQVMHFRQAAGVPKALLPYLAIDQALFRTCEDLSGLRHVMLGVSLLIGLAGVYGGYRLGEKYGGAAGGVMLGGLVATLPMYLQLCAQTRSTSDAWMFAIMAIAAGALAPGARRFWLPGLLLGLAVGSRIDMLLTAPLVLWALWDRRDPGPVWKWTLSTAGCALLALLVSSPWMVSGFLAMLRAIALTRVSGMYFNNHLPRVATLISLAWGEGLGPTLLALLAGLLALRVWTNLKASVLTAWAGLLVASMFLGPYEPMRYHGGPLLALLTCAAVAVGALLRRWPKPALAVAVALVALPLVQAVRTIHQLRAAYVPEAAAQWIDDHVPPGTTVYLHPGFIVRAILPTAAAADAIWGKLTGNEAWRFKLQDGFHRFSTSVDTLPRALSEDNLCMDRSHCRRWFLLGGGRSSRPRFDVRLVAASATFGLQRTTLVQAFKETGGVVLWPVAAGGMPDGLGEPWMKWVNPAGQGTLIFVSPDLRPKLK